MVFTRLDILWYAVPALALLLIVRWRKKKNYHTHPLVFYLQDKIRPASRLVYLPRFLEFAALGFLIIAALNPVLPSADHFVAKRGLDVTLVLDLSSSMQEPIDLKGALERQRLGIRTKEKTRLDAVKEEMLNFVWRRRGDRMGVVVFSENGYVVAPMTFDTAYLSQYLRMVDNKTLASEGQTAIGEGILTSLDLAEKQARASSNKGKVMVVLTDGENNTGRDVYEAIARARDEGFRIHFIGVEVERARDAPRLIAAVQSTGGKYYDVRDAKQLEEAYLDINRLEKGTFLVKTRGKQVPHFHPFVLIAIGLVASSIALRAVPYFTDVS
ncbi:MAG TPA: VWA domain-containing protein [Candidatus Acidoferrales bacterium]|nr:VWA domain-containing protein [Candidatus Acidoferrales bacterium]